MNLSAPTRLLSELAAHFPAGYLAWDASTLEAYGRDWTRFYQPAPCAVAFPRDAAEVCRTLAFCNEHSLAVVPSGGRTGLAGGAVAENGELVMSLERINFMDEVDPLGATVRVGAGAITQAVHEHTRPLGLTWPIDLAAKGSCHVGGNLATNAGGVRVIRYGHARHWVAGIEVATMDGQLLELGGSLLKNNSGPELSQIFIGSEGILGVITAATLKLAPLPFDSRVLFFAVEGVEAGLELLGHARCQGRLPLLAFEFLTDSCLQAVCQVQHKRPPVASAPAYVLVEVEVAQGQSLEFLDVWMEAVLSEQLVLDGVMAASTKEGSQLWGFREQITESLGHLGLMHKNDISLPVPQLKTFFQAFEERLERHYPGTVHLFGHLGDGNIHVNVRKPHDQDQNEFLALCRKVDQDLYALLQSLAGSIAAEHGIGLLKRDSLHYTRSQAEIEKMRALKRVFDPAGLLNPGKVLPE